MAIIVPPVEKMYQTGGELPITTEPEVLPDLHDLSAKVRRELTARLRLVKPKRRKGYKHEITDYQRLQLDAELSSRGFDPVKREWICFCVAAVCHLEPGCACSIGASDYRRMTNGVSGTEKVRNEVIY